MIDDRPQFAEQYGRAARSSNLRQYAHRVTDPDRLTALAWADRELATPAYRARVANDGYAIRRLRELWSQECLKLADKRRWTVRLNVITADSRSVVADIPVPRVCVLEVARLSIEHWLFDVCPTCCGRRYRLHLDVLRERGDLTAEMAEAIGRDVLSDELCPACGGTGKAEIAAPAYLLPLVRRAIESLEARYQQFGGEAIKRLARTIRE